MDSHYIPMLLTRLIYESDDPQATLEEIRRVVDVLERALNEKEEPKKASPRPH